MFLAMNFSTNAWLQLWKRIVMYRSFLIPILSFMNFIMVKCYTFSRKIIYLIKNIILFSCTNINVDRASGTRITSVKWAPRETVCLHDRSLKKWLREKGNPHIGINWITKDYMNWVDDNYFGVLHFGMHSNIPRHDSIPFDAFHLRFAITRILIAHIQAFILGTRPELIDHFFGYMVNVQCPTLQYEHIF